MPLESAIASLRTAALLPGTHSAAILAAACCWRLCVLVQRAGVDRAASSGGAIYAVVDALRAHHDMWMTQVGSETCLM